MTVTLRKLAVKPANFVSMANVKSISAARFPAPREVTVTRKLETVFRYATTTLARTVNPARMASAHPMPALESNVFMGRCVFKENAPATLAFQLAVRPDKFVLRVSVLPMPVKE